MQLEEFYLKLLRYPKTVLAIIIAFTVIVGLFTFRLDIDASAETLLLKNDKDLAFTRKINKTYGNANYLVIAYTPQKPLLSDITLKNIQVLSDALEKVPSVDSVLSILNVPLLQDPSKSVADLMKNIPTLQTGADKTLAKKEFLHSALYQEHLVSKDFKTTAILINLKRDAQYFDALNKRNALLSQQDSAAFELAQKNLKKIRDKLREENHETILKIREIIKNHKGKDQLFLGGVSMITDDMISFVKSDLKTYGLIVLLLIILIIWAIFGRLRFVFISIFIILLSVVTMTGVLGLLGLEITVISSNVISLQMIITMSLVMHLSVRYKEMLKECPEVQHNEIIAKATASMLKPSFFVILTTIVGFASLVTSGILPVIDLGWMMSIGVLISLVMTFLLFPVLMALFKKRELGSGFEERFLLTRHLGILVERRQKTILFISVLLFALSLWGALSIKVENSFIDYFKKDTEIYQGMKVIDKQLGGTTPLDIIIDFDDVIQEAPMAEESESDADDFDDFEEELSVVANKEQYWFTKNKMQKIEEIHDYLNSLPEVGKVLSLATMIKVSRDVNGGDDLDSVAFAYLYNKLPQKYKNILLKPYLDIEHNQVRFTLRVIDSMPGLRRDRLLKQIQSEIHTKLGVDKKNIHLANMMVMYNNMLQSLFSSQIMTLSIVVLSLFVVFLILFQSLQIALIASIVNLLPVATIFGVMGWSGISLDMMTITVAAISFGIAVDDTIHYIYRFRIELQKDGDYMAAMHRAHESIGSAMYYTTLIIMVGFSVLMLSNFYPTIHFGLLIVITMFMAIVADLLLLPVLLLWIKPFKVVSKEKN